MITPKKSPLVYWSRPRDAAAFLCGAAFVVSTFAGVMMYDTKERTRRHSSIEKDIERERWRAKELGLGAPEDDDGFATAYTKKVVEERRDQSSGLSSLLSRVGKTGS